jgi:hypothetical protein
MGLLSTGKFSNKSWHVNLPGGEALASHHNPWYSITRASAFEQPNLVVGQATVELYPHKCVGCMRTFKTMRQTQSYCSYACYALGNKSSGGGVIGGPETVTVGIIGPTVKKAWHIDKRSKSLSDIRDVTEVLVDAPAVIEAIEVEVE